MSISVSLQGAGLAIVISALIGASNARADEFALIRKGGPQTQQLAQNGLPPGDIPGGAEGQDAGELVVRIDRLENQLRAATGAIEELQNQNHRLEDQLKRFQEDVEFRLGGAHGAAPAADAAQPAKPPVKRSDAFEPGTDPNAVGAPRPLGTTPPSAPLTDAPPVASAPLDLSRRNPSSTPTGPLDPLAPGPTVIAGIGGPPDDPREQLNAAVEAIRGGQYDAAEQQLRAVLAKNGGGRLAPEAIFYLGETYLRRSRPREAAEQYLKLSTDYAKSSRAPEGMLRLGQSLALLGNNVQACATFGEIGRRYPSASAVVKKSVESEVQKDHC